MNKPLTKRQLKKRARSSLRKKIYRMEISKAGLADKWKRITTRPVKRQLRKRQQKHSRVPPPRLRSAISVAPWPTIHPPVFQKTDSSIAENQQADTLMEAKKSWFPPGWSPPQSWFEVSIPSPPSSPEDSEKEYFGVSQATRSVFHSPSTQEMTQLAPDTSRIVTICSPEELEAHLHKLEEDITTIRLLSVDCEWGLQRRTDGHPTKRLEETPIQLLQIGTGRGLVFLIRLCQFPEYPRCHLPAAITSVLEDPTIFKIGVGIEADQKKLLRDFNCQLRGWVELRYIAMEKAMQTLRGAYQRTKSTKGLTSLAGLSEHILHFVLDKTCQRSNWAASSLHFSQKKYAAYDVIIPLCVLYQCYNHPKLLITWDAVKTCLEQYADTSYERLASINMALLQT